MILEYHDHKLRIVNNTGGGRNTARKKVGGTKKTKKTKNPKGKLSVEKIKINIPIREPESSLSQCHPLLEQYTVH